MTEVVIDIVNEGYESHPDDRVMVYSPANRNHAGQIISTAVKEIPLIDGKATVDLAPGPVVARLECLGVADTREKAGYVPESGPVSLWDVVLDWTPALVDQGILAILAAVEGALGRVSDAVAAEVDAIKWVRGTVRAHSDLNNFVAPGVYEVPTWSTANSLINRPPQNAIQVATLTVTKTATAIHQTWQKVSTVGQDQMTMERHRAGDVWSEWREPWGIPQIRSAVAELSDTLEEDITKAAWIRRPLQPGEDIHSLRDPGVYWTPLYDVTRTLVNRPPGSDGIPGGFYVLHRYGEAIHLEWQKVSAVGQFQANMVCHRDGSGAWSEWTYRGGGVPDISEVSDTQMPQSVARAETLRQVSRLRRGGTIGTSGRTPVSLSFDHGLVNFRDLVLPHLIRLGLPCSLAINNETVGTGADGVSWSEIQQWSLDHGVEISHHARSHGDVPNALSDLPALEYQILSSKDDFEREIPEVISDSFVMPGVSGSGYEGFNGGIQDPSLLYSHPAGRMILANFPVITWGMLGQAVPMTGRPVQFVDRIGFDYSSWATIARQKILSIQDTGLGISIFCHPAVVGQPDRISEAALIQHLEWLAAERDAGRVEVLTISAFAYADPHASARLNIAPEAKWVGSDCSVDIDPLLNWAQGAQMIVETTATTSGPLTMSVTSQGGGLDASVVHDAVAGNTYRLAFSIPRSATTLTLTATGTDRRCVCV